MQEGGRIRRDGRVSSQSQSCTISSDYRVAEVITRLTEGFGRFFLMIIGCNSIAVTRFCTRAKIANYLFIASLDR